MRPLALSQAHRTRLSGSHTLYLGSPKAKQEVREQAVQSPCPLRPAFKSTRGGWASSPMMASFRLDSTGRMFFSTSSMGPGLCAIFSLRSSASLALFSFSCLACREGSAEVSARGREWSAGGYRNELVLPWELQSSSPSLWGRSRDHENVNQVPGGVQWPGLKFHKDRRRGPRCGQCVVTHNSGH